MIDESDDAMLLSTLPTPEAAELYVAEALAAQIRAQPSSVMGWATGGTMLGVYGALSQMDLSFSQVRAFNLDEYLSLPAEHPQSYHSYMKRHFFDHIDIAEDHCHIPDGSGDVGQSISNYEVLLERYGPIDMQLLGLGKNGHIGFNEPGAALNGGVKKTTLSRMTIAANARYFETPEEVPGEAVTMGIDTILSARKIILLAYGEEKAEAVLQMVEGPVSVQCPASVLQMHPNTEIVLDVAAASGLSKINR